MLADSPGVETAGEPHIGIHLAPFAPGAPRRPVVYSRAQTDRPDYFFNDRYSDVWRGPLRELILSRLAAEVGSSPVVVVKEPHGSQVADVLCSLLPGSRLLFLLRDGRAWSNSEGAALAPDGWLGGELGYRVD
jgi:hypothetical protein